MKKSKTKGEIYLAPSFEYILIATEKGFSASYPGGDVEQMRYGTDADDQSTY